MALLLRESGARVLLMAVMPRGERCAPAGDLPSLIRGCIGGAAAARERRARAADGRHAARGEVRTPAGS